METIHLVRYAAEGVLPSQLFPNLNTFFSSCKEVPPKYPLKNTKDKIGGGVNTPPHIEHQKGKLQTGLHYNLITAASKLNFH